MPCFADDHERPACFFVNMRRDGVKEGADGRLGKGVQGQKGGKAMVWM